MTDKEPKLQTLRLLPDCVHIGFVMYDKEGNAWELVKWEETWEQIKK